MAGAILERELTKTRTGRVKFDVARQTDDSDIRRLLRENPMPGRISISLEREPAYFIEASALNAKADATCQTIVARDPGHVVCVGSGAIRQRFLNGTPRRVGYLGGLRLDAGYAGRFDVLRRGYQFFRELQADAPADFYFTSIAADNQRARKFLERGFRGMPLYEFVGEFVTLLLPTRATAQNNSHDLRARLKKPAETRDAGFGVPPSGGPRPAPPEGGIPNHIFTHALRRSSPSPLREERSLDIPEMLTFLNARNRALQFAPCWSLDDLTVLQSLGLQPSDFCAVWNGGRLAACGALWDQRSFRQTVIRGYTPCLAFLRPALNAFARLAHQPLLPAIGETLANAFVSHLATRTDEADTLIKLITRMRLMANRRGIQLLTFGFAGSDPRLAAIRHNFRCHEYRSRLYVVRWPGLGGAAGELDGRLLCPEVALL